MSRSADRTAPRLSTATATMSSLARGLAILSLVQQRERMRPADIGASLDLPVSTLYRYLRQLTDSGFLLEIDGYIVPSNRLSDPEGGGGSATLTRAAGPLLRELHERTSHAAVLTVRVRTAALCLDAFHAARPYRRLSLQQGKVGVLYAGASVTPLLAFAPHPVVEEVLRGRLRRYTGATPDGDGLRAELSLIREDGYAISRGALDPGMTAIGIPVLAQGQCICALSIVGPSADLAIPDSTIQLLRDAAGQLLSRVSSEAVSAWNREDDE